MIQLDREEQRANISLGLFHLNLSELLLEIQATEHRYTIVLGLINFKGNRLEYEQMILITEARRPKLLPTKKITTTIRKRQFIIDYSFVNYPFDSKRSEVISKGVGKQGRGVSVDRCKPFYDRICICLVTRKRCRALITELHFASRNGAL